MQNGVRKAGKRSRHENLDGNRLREFAISPKYKNGTSRMPEWHPACSVGEENKEKEELTD